MSVLGFSFGSVVLRGGLLLSVLLSVTVVAPPWADAASGLDVYVGYMDTHTLPFSSQQPNPWPYTDQSRYVGTPCPSYGASTTCWDASAVRLVNNGATDITGVHVVVTMGTTVYDLWGTRTVKANSDLVLTETGSSPNSENFDGSDFAPNDYNGGLEASCLDSGAHPIVTVTIGSGTATAYTDFGQVLNAGGVDDGHCVDGVFVPGRMDESHPWALIGTAPAGGSGSGGTTATAPSAPSKLAATAGDGSVTLSWSAPASDGGSTVTGYQVLRGTASGRESSTPVNTVTSTGFTDSTVTNGTTYYYTVVAVNAVGPSPQSNEASATPQAATAPPPPPSGGGGGPAPDPGPPPAPQPQPASAPSAPVGLAASVANGSIRLSWSAPTSDGGSTVTGYQVYRGTTGGGEAATPVATGIVTTTFTDTDVTAGTTYFYTVAAVNAVGTSARSPEASAQVSSPNGRGICAGLARCHVMARADVNGDGHRDVIAMARRGGRLGSPGALILRVKTGPHHAVQTRRRLENWSGSPWVGVTRLDRRPGKEIMLGRLSGAAASFYQSITWRRGRLVLLDAPGRGRWWPLEFSATLQSGWQRRAADPVGTMRQRIAAHPSSAGTYRGRIKVYRWSRSGWHLVRTRTIDSVPLQRAQRWGGFHVPGLQRF
ncbi:MAG TPA: fibronectin type III domain-containing protein [Nocardioidaceae bacterium]|nr:fibronectin type III domain-containing protein [Nocardioidaceae bacterium]